MPLIQVSAPVGEPITKAEVKLNARVDTGATDALIDLYIAACRRYAETYTARRFINQTVELVLDAFPVGVFELGLPGVSSITSVKYLDRAGVEQTLADTQYKLNSDCSPSRLAPTYGTTWPLTRAVENAVRVRFVVGFGAAAGDVPADIRAWLLTRVTQIVQSPDGLKTADISPDPFLDQMLNFWRCY